MARQMLMNYKCEEIMRSIIFFCLFMLSFGAFVLAQTAKTDAPQLPSKIANWSGQDSDVILRNPVIIMRLKKLLDESDYESFFASFEASKPIEKSGNILLTSGCMIHACAHLESAIAIDLVNNTIHAAIYNEIEQTKYFNENGSITPETIIAWAKHLEDLKNDVATEVTDNKPKPILIDAFRQGNREDMMARIDMYLNELQNDPSAKAYIIINSKKSAHIKAEKEIRNYIKLRGLGIKRFVFLFGDGDTPALIELWLVQPDAKPPAVTNLLH